MLEIVYLSLISDVTRVVTFVPMEEGGLYHGTSHWNKSPEKSLPEMDKWDRKWIGGLAKLGGKLKAIEEGEGTFLDRTSIVYGGGHGRRPHYSHDLPILLMGGKDFGFRHGQHLAFQSLEGANPIGKESSEDQNKASFRVQENPLVQPLCLPRQRHGCADPVLCRQYRFSVRSDELRKPALTHMSSLFQKIGSLILGGLMTFVPKSILAEHRAALVMDVHAYEAAELKLPTPNLQPLINRLEAHGFNCSVITNPDNNRIKREVEGFATRTPVRGTALVYFIGRTAPENTSSKRPFACSDVKSKPGRGLGVNFVLDQLQAKEAAHATSSSSTPRTTPPFLEIQTSIMMNRS